MGTSVPGAKALPRRGNSVRGLIQQVQQGTHQVNERSYRYHLKKFSSYPAYCLSPTPMDM